MADARRRQTLSELLDDARSRINRVDPVTAHAAMSRGTLLVDIRSLPDRERDGVVPGSLHIPRTVLEWRLDPEGELRNPHVGGLDQPLLLICDHGFSSVLAAATLADLGFTHVGDVIGGFAAWMEAGLPTTKPPPSSGETVKLPGMGPPASE